MNSTPFSLQNLMPSRHGTDLSEDHSEVASLPRNWDPSTNCAIMPVRPTIFTAFSAPAILASSPLSPSTTRSMRMLNPRGSPPLELAYPAHPRYYFQDEMAVFLVDGCLFRVHRYFLDRESVKFPDGTGPRNDPIELPGVTKTEFEGLLDFLYEGMHNDKSPPSLSSWTALLSISTRFSMARIRARAISEISTYPAPGLDPVDQVALATKHAIPEWLHPAYTALCQRENALELGEAEKLGMRTTVLVARAREAARKQAGGRPVWFEPALVERIVSELFPPVSASAPALAPSRVQVPIMPPPQAEEPAPREESHPQPLPTSHTAVNAHDELSAAKDAVRPNPIDGTTCHVEKIPTEETGDKGKLGQGDGDEHEKELSEFLDKRALDRSQEERRRVNEWWERREREKHERELAEDMAEWTRAQEELRNKQLDIAVAKQETQGKEVEARADQEERRAAEETWDRVDSAECERPAEEGQQLGLANDQAGHTNAPRDDGECSAGAKKLKRGKKGKK